MNPGGTLMSERGPVLSPASHPEPGSVSRLLPDLKAGEPAAVAAVWQRFYQPLVRVAAGQLHGAHCRPAGAEDVAVDALLDFCDRVARPDAGERFPRLATREELWKLLVRFTVWAAFDHNK